MMENYVGTTCNEQDNNAQDCLPDNDVSIPSDSVNKNTMVSENRINKMTSIIANIGGVCSGIASIILGIDCFGMDTGYSIGFKTYGGDAYTGIQNAAARTAGNVHYLADIVSFGIGSILLVFGLFLLFYFIRKIIDIIALKASDNEINRNETAIAGQKIIP